LVITISEYTRRTFLDAFSIDPSRVHVVPNGVSSAFRPASDAAVEAGLRQLSLPGPYVLYVGTRERRKNLTGLLQIFSQVAAADSGMSLVVVGSRPWEEARAVHGVHAWTGRELEDEIAARGLTARVRILGRVTGDDLRILYSGADCFVFPSLFEGFGLPVLEAMACGCPVVGSDRSAVPEVVGDAGFVVDPEDSVSFANAVLHVTSDSDAWRKSAAAGLARSARFTWTRTASMTWDVYRAAADRRGTPAARK
ncbi:MAG: glycosyltransferase family 4 protein, partial [Gemmatimonadota bacterium]|nr:glycosyltransferase family 4 protein [Gemmatimonadota bacterium]